MEGTVTSLSSDNSGNIIGVSYKDKQADCVKVGVFIAYTLSCMEGALCGAGYVNFVNL